MPLTTTFDSTKDHLKEILADIGKGSLQLPDFQRNWVWDDEHVVSLLASVSLAFPIGTIMLLQAGNPDVRFRTRPVTGALVDEALEPDHLILDGQQRLTTLYQSLMSRRPVATRDKRKRPIERWYYLDIDAALAPDGDREEAIKSVPESRTIVDLLSRSVVLDLTTPARERENNMLPLSIVFDSSALMEWGMSYVVEDGPGDTRNRKRQWDKLYEQVVQPIQNYLMPVIMLKKATPKDAIVQVFEKVNTGGVALDVFDLLTATFAADDYLLRDDWARRRHRFSQSKVLRSVSSTDFLQAITLLATLARKRQHLDAGGDVDSAPAVSAKRKDVLRLTLENYKEWVEVATLGFEEAGKFLMQESIYTDRDVPYRTQIVPLAVILASMGGEPENVGIQERIARWYWCGVFGEMYGSAVESRFAVDVAEVPQWLKGGSSPRTIVDASFSAERLLTLRTRNSAAYKGLYALLMRVGERDFRTGKPIDLATYFEEAIDIHHVFPQAWCNDHGIDAGLMNSIVNKTAISARTNRQIGRNAPSKYVSKLQTSSKISADQMDGILRSHLIDSSYLRADDFEGYFQRRYRALGDLIGEAMGKSVEGDASIVLESAEGRIDYEADSIHDEDAEFTRNVG